MYENLSYKMKNNNVYIDKKLYLDALYYSKFLEYNKKLDKKNKLSVFYYEKNAKIRSFEASFFNNKGILTDKAI